MKVRLATENDIEGIMVVEKESFGPLSATKEVMKNRIDLFRKTQKPEFFLVAEENSKIKGYIIIQTTNLRPDDCISWPQATDNGTIKSTFDVNGENIFGVSIGCSSSAPIGTSVLLTLASTALWIKHGKGVYMFCSRLPGYRRMHKKTGISLENYWQLKHRDGGPRDPLLRFYWQVCGEVYPYKLLKEGFAIDQESGGAEALFVCNDSLRAILAMATILHGNCSSENKKWLTKTGEELKRGTSSENLKVNLMQGGTRQWWDQKEGRMVPATTLYVPYGCPDWGEKEGKRNPVCTFCSINTALTQYKQMFYDGKEIPITDHVELFRETLKASITTTQKPHTLMLFNAGSFLAMPEEIQTAIIKEVTSTTDIQRLVIESRAELVTPQSIKQLCSLLEPTRKQLTIRIGVETQDDHLRLHVLKKGHTREQLQKATEIMRQYNVTSGGYAILKPCPELDNDEDAIREAKNTIDWILGSEADQLGMDECYFCSTNVGPDSPLAQLWKENRFRPANLWMVLKVLQYGSSKYDARLHLLPFKDEPPFLAVPSNHILAGIPQNLSGASGCDLAFHTMLDRYRQTMNPAHLIPPRCECKPKWF